MKCCPLLTAAGVMAPIITFLLWVRVSSNLFFYYYYFFFVYLVEACVRAKGSKQNINLKPFFGSRLSQPVGQAYRLIRGNRNLEFNQGSGNNSLTL